MKCFLTQKNHYYCTLPWPFWVKPFEGLAYNCLSGCYSKNLSRKVTARVKLNKGTLSRDKEAGSRNIYISTISRLKITGQLGLWQAPTFRSQGKGSRSWWLMAGTPQGHCSVSHRSRLYPKTAMILIIISFRRYSKVSESLEGFSRGSDSAELVGFLKSLKYFKLFLQKATGVTWNP